MKRALLISPLLFLNCVVFGKSAGHQAHVHGHANLNIAFDEGRSGEIQMVIPAESIYGFEYEPKSSGDKSAQKNGLSKLETQIGKMIIFSSSLDCKFTKKQIVVQAEKDEPAHREVSAKFLVKCGKSISGSRLQFRFGKVFPRIKEIKGQLLAPNVQSEIDIDNDQGNLSL